MRANQSTLPLAGLRRTVAAVATGVLLAACQTGDSGDGTITGPDRGAASQPGTPSPAASGTRITFWTSDASPSPIAVRVNGQTVGTLTRYFNAAPQCGVSTTGATVVVDVAPGNHMVSAIETAGSGVWSARSVTITSGQCLLYEFQP